MESEYAVVAMTSSARSSWIARTIRIQPGTGPSAPLNMRDIVMMRCE